jgi:hypothetical protein
MATRAASVVVSGPSAQSRIMVGSVQDISAATNSTGPFSAVAYDEFNEPLSPQPSFVWKSSNPAAASISPINASSVNVVRTQSGVNATIFTLNSNGVQAVGNEDACVGGLTDISASVVDASGADTGVQGVLKCVVQAAYSTIKGIPLGNPPTNLVN